MNKSRLIINHLLVFIASIKIILIFSLFCIFRWNNKKQKDARKTEYLWKSFNVNPIDSFLHSRIVGMKAQENFQGRKILIFFANIFTYKKYFYDLKNYFWPSNFFFLFFLPISNRNVCTHESIIAIVCVFRTPIVRKLILLFNDNGNSTSTMARWGRKSFVLFSLPFFPQRFISAELLFLCRPNEIFVQISKLIFPQ